MAVVGTENTLTVDANVIHYYFLNVNGHNLPRGLRVRRLTDFVSLLKRYPIAINNFIKTEYIQLYDREHTIRWLKKRLNNKLAIPVDPCPLTERLKTKLRDNYGFNCHSRDARYLETCLNTIFKHLVTENTHDFDRPHRSSRKRQRLPTFLEKELHLVISTIDDCCCILLDT